MRATIDRGSVIRVLLIVTTFVEHHMREHSSIRHTALNERDLHFFSNLFSKQTHADNAIIR